MTRPPVPRPSPVELAAAVTRTLPDVLAPGLTIMFCGINPGLWSAATGHHFARPGNRFWPALHQGGFTPRQFTPAEQTDLLPYGLGITNIVARATARADDLTTDELVEGGAILAAKVHRLRPIWLAVLGVGAFRTAFARRDAAIGRQPERIGGTQVWILPNPSGLNAHYTPTQLAAQFNALRSAIDC